MSKRVLKPGLNQAKSNVLAGSDTLARGSDISRPESDISRPETIILVRKPLFSPAIKKGLARGAFSQLLQRGCPSWVYPSMYTPPYTPCTPRRHARGTTYPEGVDVGRGAHYGRRAVRLGGFRIVLFRAKNEPRHLSVTCRSGTNNLCMPGKMTILS